VVEPIFLPGAFGGIWETAAPFGCGSAAVRRTKDQGARFQARSTMSL
jgi:hypothetical protein